jgi:hypothetical protein
MPTEGGLGRLLSEGVYSFYLLGLVEDLLVKKTKSAGDACNNTYTCHAAPLTTCVHS